MHATSQDFIPRHKGEKGKLYRKWSVSYISFKCLEIDIER